jgi:hypothetical protein
LDVVPILFFRQKCIHLLSSTCGVLAIRYSVSCNVRYKFHFYCFFFTNNIIVNDRLLTFVQWSRCKYILHNVNWAQFLIFTFCCSGCTNFR